MSFFAACETPASLWIEIFGRVAEEGAEDGAREISSDTTGLEILLRIHSQGFTLGYFPFLPPGGAAQACWSATNPTLVHPIDEDLSLGTPKPQQQKHGEGGVMVSRQRSEIRKTLV
jgi:hypothetical protein